MLRAVLSDYLDRVKEREFDLPFMALLPELGFYDIHFTHGQVEFGKDFIAKRMEDGEPIQYSFQSKAGDIGEADWRNTVMGQTLESVLTTLSHPNFDSRIPHQALLVTTGKLKGNARLGLQNMNDQIKDVYQKRPVICWEKPQLLDYLEKHGLSGIHQATASGLADYGQFYLIYSRALNQKLSEREIEQYSCCWLDASIDIDKRILRGSIEAEIIATQCLVSGFVYEAIHAHLAALRVVLATIYETDDSTEIQRLAGLYRLGSIRLRSTCRLYLAEVQGLWEAADKDLVKAGFGGMMTYLVHCARILEIAGCVYFLEADLQERERLAAFIADFTAHEQGCGHIPSDRHAVSILLPTLALCHSGRADEARALIQRAAVWLCDRYEAEMGLARFDADQNVEVNTLLGYPFDFIDVQRSASFLAAVLSDLAAFSSDTRFYSSVVNAIRASSILPTYWQPQDTKGQFRIEGEDVITYPNVRYRDTLMDFESYQFAEHIRHEPRSFKVAELVGPLSLMALSLLLRDRYFPTLWPALLSMDAG